MRKIMAWVILAWLLWGCYHENPDLSSEVPVRTPDIITDSGILVYVDTADKSLAEDHRKAAWREIAEKEWHESQICLGMFSDNPPTVLVVDSVDSWVYDRAGIKVTGKNGYAFFKEALIIIEYRWAYKHDVWRHEFIHIILHQNNVADFLNIDHKPDYLWLCQTSR